MATSVKITTPIPSSTDVAERYGISRARRTSITTIARETVGKYHENKTVLSKKASAKKKVA